ncbi:hypothetical protein QYE76_023555 [Lolium multiflorum]|uniref:Retrotransposon gag domain-containing protein n=1 Tax=Lolium multiflorum TaxID=4521 RepID=A0AAD8RAH0_LOLMU|nr:hypothetical protein QYE76_023555 [Lolium multiflorum]
MAEEQITYEDLPPDHKKKYDELKAIVEAELIGSFEKTRSHGIRFKGFTPQGVLDGVDLSLPSDERTRALRQEINYVVAHSLHRHSESLVNSLERVAFRVVQEIMERRYSPSGPALGTHQGEVQLHTRPPLPYAMAAPQQQGSPAYVVHKVGGDPGDYQFLYEPPKEIPHGPGKLSCHHLHRRSDQRILRDQFGILPKKKIIGYSKPYPNEFDLIPLPPKYRLPDFNKFSGSEGSSSIEHVSRYLAQLGMASASDQLRVRCFSQSLTGPAFGWYTSLQPNSRRGETVAEYIQRFRTVKNRCYSVHLTEKEAVELAVAGLAASFKDLTFQVEYNSLMHLVSRLTLYEQRHPELYQDKFKRAITLVNADEDDSAEDQEVAVAEWTRTPYCVLQMGEPARASKRVGLRWFVIRHGKDKAESSHSRGKDKEEAVPRDRPQDDDRRYLTEEEVRSIRYQRPLSVHLLNKYEQQYDRRRYDEDDEKYRRSAENRRYRQHDRNNDGYERRARGRSREQDDLDKHWDCPFFKHCWDSGMSRLPTIENCPECKQRRRRTNEVSVFERLGPLPPINKRAESSQEEDFEESDGEEDRYHRPRWCPMDSAILEARVQRRNLEEARHALYTLRRARPDLAVKIQQTVETKARPPKKVWRPKQAKADAHASADADAEASADTNMISVTRTE